MVRIARQTIGLLILLALAAFALARRELLPPYVDSRPLYDAFFLVPYGLLALTAFLGLRINQTRILAICLALAATYAVLLGQPETPFDAHPLSVRSAGVLFGVPIATGLLLLSGEGRVLGLHGAVRGAAGLLFAFLAVTFATTHPERASELLGWQLALAVIALFGIAALVERDGHLRIFHIAHALAWLPLGYALALVRHDAAGRPKLTMATAFTAAAVLMLYSLFEIYWQKVYIDELTAIPNRRALNEYLRSLGRDFSIAMVDIDFFKKFNDTYGHDEGDNVLRFVARHLERESDTKVFRYGGEEFCVVFPDEGAEDAYGRLDEVREKLASREFVVRAPKAVRKKTSRHDRGKTAKGGGNKRLKVTVSIGVAEASPRAKSPAAVMSVADKALYRAKEEGRNRVELA